MPVNARTESFSLKPTAIRNDEKTAGGRQRHRQIHVMKILTVSRRWTTEPRPRAAQHRLSAAEGCAPGRTVFNECLTVSTSCTRCSVKWSGCRPDASWITKPRIQACRTLFRLQCFTRSWLRARRAGGSVLPAWLGKEDWTRQTMSFRGCRCASRCSYCCQPTCCADDPLTTRSETATGSRLFKSYHSANSHLARPYFLDVTSTDVELNSAHRLSRHYTKT